MQMKSTDNNNVNTPLTDKKTLIATLSYAIVPTIWCCGSQGKGQHNVFLYAFLVMDFRLSFARPDDIAALFYITTDLRSVATFFMFTYPLAHSIATLIGLGPYRRCVIKMFVKKKKIASSTGKLFQ
jgi:hypothetical protein